jgi:pSer/pThr/pTyr-binding forkhead associated (FHA) protein
VRFVKLLILVKVFNLVKIRSKEKVYPIIEYSRPPVTNYIILESLNQVKDNNNQKSIQVITLDENEKILMGRGHETDVRINDISVSRSHAHLSLVNGRVYLKDLKSKFGTLILVQNDIQLGDKPIALQIGRTYGEFSAISQKELAKLPKE